MIEPTLFLDNQGYPVTGAPFKVFFDYFTKREGPIDTTFLDNNGNSVMHFSRVHLNEDQCHYAMMGYRAGVEVVSLKVSNAVHKLSQEILNRIDP